MIYYYYQNGVEKKLIFEEDSRTILVRINKRHSYQDSDLEKHAMRVLSSDGFVAHCSLANNPANFIWVVDLDDYTMGHERILKAMDELMSNKYLHPTVLDLIDTDGEVVAMKGFDFFEAPMPKRF